ncbi:endonuclease/exonuclease/phosphatase family protein [Microbacterium abyssi]|uniref:endonuclease/exonuclease/phosphatase family protein n=1 Tax=Microbacterium abyssi TaxID=2782166 RepID=UPI0018874815|nr:endonuclease/exonuclease/phosphatase family protein [Microbacterium sp. A18JL241]
MESIRAMTWNVWWRFGGNWDQREPGLIAVVRDQRPDVLGVQECWGDAETTQAHVLADALGGHAAFVDVGLPPTPSPLEDPSQEGAVMGLGLVSRWPIARAEKVPMPSFGRVNAALLASVDHPLGELRLVVGATSWEPERMAETTAQVKELRALTRDSHATRALPSILLADLNYDRAQPPLADIDLEDAWDAAVVDADPRTLSATNRFAPREATSQFDRRIDHILYAPGLLGARATDAWIVRDEPGGLPPSDHYPLVADIRVGDHPD